MLEPFPDLQAAMGEQPVVAKVDAENTKNINAGRENGDA